MALSQFTITVADGNLGLVSTAGAENVLKFDVCTKGIPGQLQTFNSLSNVSSTLGLGAGAFNVAQHLVTAGGPVSFVALEPSIAGSISSVTHVGSGSGTITLSAAPTIQKSFVVSTTGVNGVARYKVLDADGYTGPFTVPAAADGYTARIAGTYMHGTFPQGTYTSGDSATITTSGTVVLTGAMPSVTQSSDPINDYNGTITILKDGTTGTAKFTYSMDGYNTSPAILLGSTYAIPNTGIVIAASGTFASGDLYTFQTCGPTFQNADYLTAVEALGLQTPFSMVHINNKHATAALAAAFAADVIASTDYLFEQAMYVRAMMNCPTAGSVSTVTGSLNINSEANSTTEAAFLNLVDTRLAVGARDCILPDPISGLSLRCNWSLPTMTRLAALDPATDAAEVDLGGIPTVVAISDDERLDEGLSDAGFTVPCTIVGRPGFYINQALTMASKINSDFSYIVDCRVMDLACNTTRQALIGLLNSQVPVTKTGVISPIAADRIDARGNRALAGALVTAVPQQAVAATASVDRAHVMTDNKLFIIVSIRKFAYARTISATLGFSV